VARKQPIVNGACVAFRVLFSYDARMISWTDPLAFIHGLTAQQRRALKSLEVETVGELLSIFPRRYDDYTRLVPIAKIPTGVPVTIKATVKEIKQMPTFRRRFALIGRIRLDRGDVVQSAMAHQAIETRR
jgi:RecG-like helicase